METSGSPEGSLTRRERSTLRLFADTLIPSLQVPSDPDGFYHRSASVLGVDADVAHIAESYLLTADRAGFRRILRAIESPFVNLLLTGRPSRFSSLSAEERETYLLDWARSRLSLKRLGFQAVKRLVMFVAYAKAPSDDRNPNWVTLGYGPPDAAERSTHRHPVEASLDPLRPSAEVTLETDVCVVGSGAGGSVIAAKLAEAGHRVLVLEAGPYRTADDFTQREADTYDTMFQRHGVLTTADSAFGVLAGQTAGGSATINWMTCLKPPLWARQEWARESGLTDVADVSFDRLLNEVWERMHVNEEESIVNPSNDVLRRGCEALGYRMGSDYDVIPRNASGCAARCDFCFFGCIYNAKQSPLLTYLPDAHHAGAQFLFDTVAATISIREGEARGVEARYGGGGADVPVHVRCRAVVASGSAVQTPALLLRSGVHFAGVGRGLRLDPTTALLGEFPTPIRMWSGPMQTIYVHRFQSMDVGHHGPWLESAPGHPGLSALALPWFGGRAHKDRMRRLAYVASTIVLVRDVAEGRVTIDSRGEPILQYRLSNSDRRNLARGLEEAAKIQRAAGALRIATLHLRECSVGDGVSQIGENDFAAFVERIRRLGVRDHGVALFSAHPMGSARAGPDPRTSTAKPTGECHEVRDLWIGDGSLLPSAPGVNPMITIMAFAARTARFIHDRLAHRRDG